MRMAVSDKSMAVAWPLAPENAAIRYHKAMIVAEQGKTAQAISSLEELLAEDPDDFPEKEQAMQLLQALKAPDQN